MPRGIICRTFDFQRPKYVIFLVCLILGISTSVQAADSCNDIFMPGVWENTPAPGARLSLWQKLSLKISHSKNSVSGAEAIRRYSEKFGEIFPDVHPVFFSEVQTKFDPHLSTLAVAGIKSGNIKINSKIKNHPLYPLFHAHELQHVFDMKVGELRSQSGRFQEQIIDSEIRAFHRQTVAAKKIFTLDELIQVRNSERNSDLRNTLSLMIDNWNTPGLFIGIMILASPHYESALYATTKSTSMDVNAIYVRNRTAELLGVYK